MIRFVCHQTSHLLYSDGIILMISVVLMSDQVSQCPSCGQCNDVVLGQNHPCMGFTFSPRLSRIELSSQPIFCARYFNLSSVILLRYDIGDGSQTLAYQSGKPMGRRNEGVE